MKIISLLYLPKRIIGKIKNSHKRKLRALFFYDRMRFYRFSGIFIKTQEGDRAKIIMAYHVIEKGLTMPNRHASFGHDSVLKLISLIQKYELQYSANDLQVQHAVGVIHAYWEMHRSISFDCLDVPDFWNQVDSFLKKHKNISVSQQIHISRNNFYASKNAPFPAFSCSRHTVRHFYGSVDNNSLNEAVKLALNTPSACNRQHTRIHCISNQELIGKILSLQNGNRGFGLFADKLLIVTGDLSAICWMEERNDLYTNVGMFMMNLCYALHYYEIAHCVLNWSVVPQKDLELRELVSLNDSENVVAFIVCGNAPEFFDVAASPRKNIEEVFITH